MKKIYYFILSCLLLLSGSIATYAQTFEPVEYDKVYTVGSNDPLFLTIDLPVSGYLTIDQKGSTDTHLFRTNDPANRTNPVQIHTAIPSDGYTYDSFEGYNILPYPIEAGTYYYMAPFPYDDLSRVVFHFEPTTTIEKIITLDQPFEIEPGVNEAVFTSNQGGFLKVSTTFNGNLVATGSFLYADRLFKSPVTCFYNEKTDQGSNYYFSIVSGTAYYLYIDAVVGTTLTFAMVDEVPGMAVEVFNIDPLPGKAFNTIEFHDGAHIIFNPVNIEYDKIEFSYTDRYAQEVVKDVTGNFRVMNTLRVNIADLYTEALSDVDLGSKCKITIYNVNYENIPLTASNVEGVTIDENGTMSFEYTFSVSPQLVEAKIPSPFYAYWPENDPAGIATFTFDQDIEAAENASVIYAHIVLNSPTPGDNEPIYYSVTPEINGNVVTYNFTGFHYDREGNQITTYNGKEISLFIPSFTGVNGLSANMGATGISYLSYIPYVDSASDGGEVPLAPSTTMGPGENVGSAKPYAAYLGDVLLTWNYTELTAIGDLTATLTYNGEPTENITMVKLIEIDPEETGDPEFTTRAAQTGNVLFIGIEPEDIMSGYPTGTYVLTIPEGIVVNEKGEVNPLQEMTFHILPIAYDAQFTPEDNSDINLEENPIVTVSWAESNELTYNPGANKLFVESPIEVFTLEFGEEVTISDGCLKIDLSTLETGQYNLVVPEAYVILGNESYINNEALARYIITNEAGIADIIEDELGVYRVYDLRGINILTTTESTDLSSLLPGIYVINGKKVILRK